MRVKLIAALVVLAAGSVCAASAAAANAPAGGTIYIHATAGSGPAGTIVIVGAIGDHGKTLQINRNGKTDSNGNFVKITLSKGTFEVDSTVLNRKTNSAPPTVVNRKTCSFMFGGSGPVTLFNGTGLYKGIKGKLAITLTFGAVGPLFKSGPHKGQCNLSNSAKPVAQFGVVSGHGAVSFG